MEPLARKLLIFRSPFGITGSHTLKTAISLDDDLMRKADRAAREIGVSRSRLFSLALRDYLQTWENNRILERLNLAYGSEPDETERRLTAGLKGKFHSTVKDPW